MALTPENIIKESISYAKQTEARARRREIEKSVNYYTATNIDKYIRTYFNAKSFQEIPTYCVNVTRKFIDKKSRIYTLAPDRKTNTNQKQYNNLTRFKDLRMKHVERMTNLLGTPGLRVLWNEDEDGGFFDYRLLYYYDAHFVEDDVYNPYAITYPILSPSQDPMYTEKCKYSYWDSQINIIYDENGAILDEFENPYGVLPFLFPRDMEQIDDFYNEGATDVVKTNEHINIAMTELMLGLRFQMFGQPWSSGVYEDNPITRTGSDTIINLPVDGRFGIESPKGDPNKVIETIKFSLEMLAMSKHMYVTFESSQDRPSSGLALKIKDFEYLEDYKDDLSLWRAFEKELYDLEKIIAGVNGVNLADKMVIDFKEPEYPKSVQEQITKDNWDLEKGLITLPEILKRDRSDLTIEQAEAIIEKNLEGQETKDEVEDNGINKPSISETTKE